MIQLIFDFTNNIATYKDGELTVVRRLDILKKNAYWQTASFAFNAAVNRRIIARWKVWKECKQIVELDEYDEEMYEVARWFYTEGAEVSGGRCGYSVIVVGSKYGDWMSI
jgi:hypothetical protein